MYLDSDVTRKGTAVPRQYQSFIECHLANSGRSQSFPDQLITGYREGFLQTTRETSLKKTRNDSRFPKSTPRRSND